MPDTGAMGGEAMRQFNPEGLCPCMDSEYYMGWLTHWGETMANTSTTDAVSPGRLSPSCSTR